MKNESMDLIDNFTQEELNNSEIRENIEKLEKQGKIFALIYKILLEQSPWMAEMDIDFSQSDEFESSASGGYWMLPQDEMSNPVINFNAQDNLDNLRELIQKREITVQSNCDLLGVDFEYIEAHPQILQIFIFLHEIGHVKDFLENYKHNPQRKNSAIKISQSIRAQEMSTLPVPGKDATDLIELHRQSSWVRDYYTKYQSYFVQRGINSVNDLIYATERRYRNLPTEKIADNFALSFLNQHAKELGINLN